MAQERQRGVAFAKTTRPVIGSAVRRERLFARMDETPGRTISTTRVRGSRMTAAAKRQCAGGIP